jgi:LCP family protein required for cell wall assembly
VTLSTHLRRNLIRATVILVVAVVAWAGWQGFQIWHDWRNIARVPYDIAAARDALSTPATLPDPATIDGADAEDTETPGTMPPELTIPTSPQLAPEALQAFLVIGSDQRPQLGTSSRADVIVLLLIPADGADPVMVSIPRDLYLPNPCAGGYTRINATLNGCASRGVSGPELLTVALEDFTGVQIDHFAAFDFEGFKAIIDRVGGVEICVANQVRDSKTDPPLDLPAGCSRASGAMTLSWVRSRHTQELVDGAWRRMPGVNDLARNQRQQELLLQALARLKAFGSVTEFSNLVESLTNTFTIDAGLSLGEAIGIAWDLRSIDIDSIKRPTIPVADYTTEFGQQVLRPTATFSEVLEAAYPGAAALVAED